jgi:Ni/Co efflux regulator RcnB
MNPKERNMRTTILALAAVATLGLAAPAFAQSNDGNAARAPIAQSGAQDFSASHRHWRRHHHHRWYWRHHHRRHHWCGHVWRYGHRVWVCR